MTVLTFVGFGELAAGLSEGLASSGRHELRAYLRRTPAPGSPRAARLQSGRIRPSETLSEAISGASCVLATIPASAQSEVTLQCAPLLDPGALYVDFAATAPAAKETAAERVGAAGGSYVDAAVLGTVLTSGAAVPILASGPGARAFRELVAPDGLNVTTIDAPAGVAARIKLIRGIYLKGRDALIVEMMLTARRFGLEQAVVESIEGPGERVPFGQLSERVLRSLAVHAERRALELSASSEVVREAGIDPAFTQAGARTLGLVGDLGLRELFGGERPGDADAVLDALDVRLGPDAP